MTRAAVMGAGSFGTTLAGVLADAGTDTMSWCREPDVAAGINERHENPAYLPGMTLPDSLRATNDPQEAVDGRDFVVLATPSQFLRPNLKNWAPLLPPDAVLVSVMKGIELGTLMRMSEVIAEVSGRPADRIAVISGPNLAKQIAQKQPAATVVACPDLDAATMIQNALATPYFRPYTSTDVVGAELGGACKNVIALACGMAAGMGLGDNSLAALMTRGLAEISRLAVALGADPMTLAGLAGLGDLIATCVSPLSRNRTVGTKIAEGYTVAEIEGGMRMVAEGVKSCVSIQELSRREGVEMPITDVVVGVVHDGDDFAAAVKTLMSRDMKQERLGD